MEIAGAERADRLRGRQVKLLFAYLVLSRSRHVGRDELIGVLWPGQPPRSEDASLRTLLSRLRTGLGAGRLAGRDELILTLPEPVWVDAEAAAAEVQRARATLERDDPRSAWALAQVPLNIAARGLLPGVSADWLEPRRRELEDVRLLALEVIGSAGLRLGGAQLASVERTARALLESEPYRESGYVLLMEALAAQGNLAEALRVFARLRRLLRDELGTNPSPATIAAHERLLKPQQPPRAVAASVGEDQPLELPSELRAHARAHAQAPLVGRARELDRLGQLWAIASGRPPAGDDAGSSAEPTLGFGRIVMLVGDPGIGKTRLASELAARAHAGGAVVLAGRAPEEALVPYQPFLEALRHYLMNVPLLELRSTAREYGSELARLVPELRRRAPELPPAPTGEPETERYRLFEAVVGLLSAISVRAPVLLVLDDLHWADRPTLLLLRHIARAVDPARVMVLGAYRATETQTDSFENALSALGRERLVTVVELGGLSEHETAEFVERRSGQRPSAPFIRALHEETGGNPFFVGQIVRHLAEAGVEVAAASPAELQRVGLPQGVRDVISRRLARLDTQTLETLRAAAVIGRDFDPALLESVVALDEERFLAALDEALAARLVVESADSSGKFGFTHALVRETLYESMSAPRRARFHRRVANALEARGGERQLAVLAHHYARASGSAEAEKAIDYATRAGASASSMLVHEDAAEHYGRAVEVLARTEPDALARRCELLLLAGEARVRSGDRVQAWSAFFEAAALAEKLGDGTALARAAIGASQRHVQPPGVVDRDLVALLERALELSTGERSVLRAHLLARLCGALYYSASERGRMHDLSAEAAAIARELGDDESRAYACAARRRALWDAAHLEQRLAASTEMLRCARRIDSVELELQAHAWLVVDLLERGDRDAVDAQLEAFVEGSERVRQPLYLWNAQVWRAMRALLEGKLEEAAQLAGDAAAAGASAEAFTAQQYYAVQLLAVRREQDRIAELEDSARALVAANPERPAWRAALAALLFGSGKLEEAGAEFSVLASAGFADIPHDLDWITAIVLLSEVCTGLGDSACAELLYEQLSPYRERNVVIGLAAVCLGATSRYLGNLAHTAGRAGEAAIHFEHALAANATLRAPICLAHTQLDYAATLEPGPRASALIDEAARTARELGLPWLARRAVDCGARAGRYAPRTHGQDASNRREAIGGA